MGDKELRRKIETFSLDDGDLGNQGYERVLLQLFGYSGHGKSSFINSCKYVLNDGGPFREYAEAGHKPGGDIMTIRRNAFELTPKITIMDNRGCNKMNSIEHVEIYTQLGNFCPLNEEVEWKKSFNDAMSVLMKSDMDLNYTDFLVPLFIYSGNYPFGGRKLKTFLNNCVKITGVFPIIIITQKNSKDYPKVERMFKLMGAEVVIGIENYTKVNNQKSLERNIEILKVIDKALENVRFRLDLPRDPKGERIVRKKFLLNHINEVWVKPENVSSKEFKSLKKEKIENEGIFTREHPDLYQWLVRFLLLISVVKDGRQDVITNNFFEFQQEVFKCSFAILYHSKRRGRLNVTDVTDSLYDRELQHLNETLGRKRVLVVIDHLEDSSDYVKKEILNSQQSIQNLAEELFLFSTTEKALLGDIMASGYQSQSDLKNKLDRMKLIIEGKKDQRFPEVSRLVSWPEETRIPMPDPGPGTQTLRKRYRSPMCMIGIGIGISIIIFFVVGLLPICTTIKKKEEKTAAAYCGICTKQIWNREAVLKM